MQPSQLDLQLAWAFRDFPVVWDRLARRGARLADAEGAWTRHLHMRNAWQTLRTLEEHAEFHGVHPRVEPDGGIVRLRWPLTLWPEYELAGFFAPSTGVVEEGLRFREPPIVERASQPLTLENAMARLRLGEHTEVELHGVLGAGEPDVGNGWSPEAYFHYELADGRVLQCLTVHGLLVEVTALDTRPERVVQAERVVDEESSPIRRRRWWEFWKPAA